MQRKKIILSLLAGVLTLVAVFGVITYRVVSAQAPTPTPGFPAQPGFGFGKEFRGGGTTDQDLADALGIPLTQLQAAYQTANTEALKQAVAAGLITQAQADELARRGVDFRRLSRFPGLKGSTIDYNALLAQALGISTDKLQAAYQKAYSTAVDRAVQNGRLTQAQADAAKGRYALSTSSKFIDAMKAAFEAAVKQAVSDGLITQAQADQILQNKQGMGFPGFRGFGGFEGPRGRLAGRHRGGWGWGKLGYPANPAPPAAPTAAPSGGL